jgi:hypothetical protein
MKKILVPLFAVLATFASLLFYLNNHQLKEDLEQSQSHLWRLEAWHRADSLFFTGDSLAARQAWAAQGAAEPLSSQAIDLRLAFLQTAANNALLRKQQRDSLQSVIAAYMRTNYLNRENIETLERRLYRSKTDVAELTDSLQSLSDDYQAERRRLDSLAAEQAAYQQAMDEKLADMEARAQSKQILKFKSPSNVDIVYIGETKDGKAHGHGIGLWVNGTAYTGQWERGKKHGQGLYEYPEGEKFEGGFVNDKRQGFGIYTWKNGDRYAGFWQDDLRHGEGTITNNKGEVVREGLWEKDQLVQRRRPANNSQQ